MFMFSSRSDFKILVINDFINHIHDYILHDLLFFFKKSLPLQFFYFSRT